MDPRWHGIATVLTKRTLLLLGRVLTVVGVASKHECCAACRNQLDCTAAGYVSAEGTCALRHGHKDTRAHAETSTCVLSVPTPDA